jgi:hypothetical protein
MRSVLFLVGLVLGFLGGVGTIIYLQQRNKDTGEMLIVFAKKNYYETPAVVTVSGTLTGEGLGYPNNTYSIACFQDRKECWMTSVEAIGGLHIRSRTRPAGRRFILIRAAAISGPCAALHQSHRRDCDERSCGPMCCTHQCPVLTVMVLRHSLALL